MGNWNIHNCWRDKDCRSLEINPPHRIYFNTPRGSLIIATRWSCRIQAWLPFKGYTNWWWPIVWHPRSKW